MDILRTGAFLILALAARPATASAQVASPPEPGATVQEQRSSAERPESPAASQLGDVEVVGQHPAQADRIDRRVYNVAQDPLAGSSTALEVIGRLPSVSVSASGVVTLLGQGAASLLIDGKPVVNAEALRALLGSDLDRVEVMTNPSAEFRAQGTGGVVNVITRRRRPIGLSGNILTSADTLDNLRLSLSTSASIEKLTVTWNAMIEEASTTLPRSRTREALTPTVANVLETSDYAQSGENGSLGGSATYQYNENRSMTLGGSISRSRSDSTTASSTVLTGSTVAAYDELALGRGGADTAEANFEYNLKMLEQRASTKFSATISSNDFFTSDEYARTFDPAAPQELFGSSSRYSTDKASVAASLEYDRTADLVIKAGLNFDVEDQVISRLTDTNQPFNAETTLIGDIGVWAAYGSIQWPLHGWTVMPGLRAEQATYNIDAVPLARDEDIDLFPSLYLRRQLHPDWTANLSYSRRINRPDLGRLDPRPVFSTPTDVSVGAPDLAPEFTDAFEARLEYVSGENNASATAYHRVTRDVWQASFSLTPDDIVVQTFINAGTRNNTGLDLSVRRIFSDRFRVSGTLNVFRSEHDAQTGPVISRISSTQFITALTFTYKPLGSDPMSDTFQWSLRYSGPSRGYQTNTSELFFSSLAWRRPLSERLTSVLTVSDLFDSGDQTFELDTPDFLQTVESRGLGPQLRWTLTYRFGALR